MTHFSATTFRECSDSLRRILIILDEDALYENPIQGFYLFLKGLKNHYVMQGDYRHLCIDEKNKWEWQGFHTNNSQLNYAILNSYGTSPLRFIECEPIDKEENDLLVAQRLLKQMNLNNSIVNVDALHC